MLSELGPYFAFDQGLPSDVGSWLTVEQSLAPDVLDARVEETRQRIAVGSPIGTTRRERRAVASTVATGLFSRLLSPTVGALLTGTLTHSSDPTTTWLRPSASGPAPLRTTAPLVEPDPHAAITGLVMPFLQAFGERFRVSERILLGNAAAAVAGACEVVDACRPELSGRSAALRAQLLSTPPLLGAGTATGPFMRNSCCLIYQLPMRYICGSCVLLAHDTPTAQRRREEMAPTLRRLEQQPRPDSRQPPFRRAQQP